MQREGTSSAVKVALVEDRKEFRDALTFLIGSSSGFTCVAACAGADEALAQLPAAHPDVILLDIDLGEETTGIDLIAPLKRALPSAEILMLTALDRDELIFRAVRLGASGYLRRNTPRKKLLSAIRDVYEGGSAFSPDISRLILQAFQTPAPAEKALEKLSQREEEILGYLAQGYVPKEIAEMLGTSPETVKTQIKSVRNKLEVQTQAQAIKKLYPTKKYQATVRRVDDNKTV